MIEGGESLGKVNAKQVAQNYLETLKESMEALLNDGREFRKVVERFEASYLKSYITERHRLAEHLCDCIVEEVEAGSGVDNFRYCLGFLAFSIRTFTSKEARWEGFCVRIEKIRGELTAREFSRETI